MRFVLALLSTVVPAVAFAGGGLSAVGSVTLPSYELTSRGTFSADGAHAYLAISTFPPAEKHGGVAAFSRDAVTGALTPIGTVVDDEPTIDGLDDAREMVLSPDGLHLYVASTDDDGVTTLARDPGTGALTYVGLLPLGQPLFTLAISPDGKHLYTQLGDSGPAAVLSRDVTTGVLTDTSLRVTLPTNLASGIITGVAISPDGTTAYSAGGDRIVTFTRDATTGMLTQVQDLAVPQPVRDIGTFELPAIEHVVVSPDGDTVYALGTGWYSVVEYYRFFGAFDRDAATGLLTPRDVDRLPVFGRQQRFTVSTDGRYAFASSNPLFASGTLPSEGVFAMRLHPTVENFHVVGGVQMTNPSSRIMVSPDTRHVYVSDTESFTDAVQVFGFAPLECPPAPRPGCRQPTAAKQSKLVVQTGSTPEKSKINWRWNKGAATTAADFGNPLLETDHQTCLYDATGLRLDAIVPGDAFVYCGKADTPAACWKQGTNLTFTWKDRARLPDGISDLRLQPGVAGRASIKLGGVGRNLAVPAPPLTLPVTMQLASDTGVCWEAVYTAAKVNRPDKFQAVTD